MNPTDPDRRRFGLLAGGLLLAQLPGCGGTDGGLVLLPGTGGTGAPLMVSFGSIRGFGSVIVNGVHFDDSQASVDLDGAAQTPAQLRLGMMAQVQGQFDKASALGSASRIEVWSLAQGAVLALADGSFEVAGLRILTDIATVFDGVAGPAALQSGMTLRVWGLQADASQTLWLASRIERVEPGLPLVTTGALRRDADGYSVNGIRCRDWADGAYVGQTVRVAGNLSHGSLSVASMRLSSVPASQRPDDSHAEEIEGVVTALLSSTRFMLGSDTIELPAAGSLPGLGQRIEVYGYWLDGVFRLSTLKQESDDSLQEVHLRGEISAFNGAADFVVRNQRCDASGSVQVEHGSLAELRLGRRVRLKGRRVAEVVQVTEIEFDD